MRLQGKHFVEIKTHLKPIPKKNRFAWFTPTVRRWARRVVGLVLLALMVGQVLHQQNLTDWWADLQQKWQDGSHAIWLVATLALLPLNWGLEVAKWRQLLLHNWAPSWGLAARAVLAGVTVSLATPNRVGEYGGRALIGPAQHWMAIVSTSILGSVCQWMVFVACGWPPLMYALGQYWHWPAGWMVVVAASVPVLVLVVVAYGHLVVSTLRLSGRGSDNKWWRWLMRKALHLRRITRRQFRAALLLGLLRFWVYSTQYLMMLWFFNVSIGFWEGLGGIFSIYLIQAGIPLPPGLGVITRSELAILLWRDIVTDPAAILSATFGLYIINLVIPALLGAWFIVRTKE